MVAKSSIPEQRPLARSSQGTLHHQLYRTLSQMINTGVFKPGQQIPTEAELIDRFAVSRTTARRALDELRREGRVERQPGRGTFVLPPRLSATIPHLHSITAEIEQLGYRAGIIPLSIDEAPADDVVASNLEIEVGDPVLVVRRIRTADEQPVYFGTSTLNLKLFPDLAHQDFTKTGLYPMFEQVTGLTMTRAVQWLSAIGAPAEVASSLMVKVGTPVLQLERIVYMAGDKPIENVLGYFHGGVYRHYSESVRATD